ncbi:MAG: flagellar basal body P-ring formation chaperone FlgA [Pseudotabrizicola sp.]|uniref:flagellar basal body P-ring formation chaperone FlgA n=1 Tax=Pseudotabrizicola sp. TaxID=2939647 RepID=UPI002731D006|nr:flagellar basal body P-ring formation chaperone FlgA [Pseudotabrizicola sp.]MDP2081150.1 flagellar basal body P-ring formation chaperone FlgA [Pseudotabrizicola sp.]MDZ7575709.1 flagellar basal body P-ring formation chaperone FlgA [Pseudotabrizicola sp.]
MRWVILCLIPCPALADALVTTRIVKAGQVIEATDLTVVAANIPGTVTDPTLVTGQEARVALYPGRPIREGQFGPPTRIIRNQIVPLTYVAGTLVILTEGRALDRGGVGDVIPVLNLSSRNTVQGRVMPDGTVSVSPSEG